MTARLSPDEHAKLQYVLRLADTNLILGQRLAEWVGHAPALEEDLALGNIALDHIGQARLLLTYAGEIEGRGRSEDDLAFTRDGDAFRNLSLAEQPNGDFAGTIVRQWLIDAFQVELYTALQASADQHLSAVAAKALREARYHLRYSSGWVIRLGDGTPESHERVQAALDRLWRFTQEFFDPDDVDQRMQSAGIAPSLEDLRRRWSAHVDEVLADGTLTRPADSQYPWHGKCGDHTEHLGYILAEMQHLHRAHPGASW